MKKIVCLLCVSFALMLSACGSEEEVKKSEVEIKQNEIYTAPATPTDAEAKLFNKLTKAINEQDGEKIATLVAQNFVFDFFSLKNKESAQDVGGLTYLPANRQEAFKTFAMGMVYSNYATIVNDSGKKNLPMVSEVKVEDVQNQEIEYTDIIPANSELGTPEEEISDVYNGYVVTMSIAYDKTDVKELKENVIVTVIDLDGRWCVIAID